MATRKEYVDVDFSGNRARNLYGLTDANGEVTTDLPALRPSLLVDTANAGMLSPRFSVVRASQAARQNRLGGYDLVGNNVAAVDYHPTTGAPLGIPILAGSVNLFPNPIFSGTVGSQLPPNWSVTGGGAATTVAAGGFLGSRIVQIRMTGGGYQGLQQALSLASGTQLTASVLTRVPTGVTAADLLAFCSSASFSIASAATLDAQPKDVWIRRSVTFTLTSAITYMSVCCSGAIGTGVDVQLPQLEVNSMATPFQDYGRAGDLITIPLGDWYNQQEGTVVVKAFAYGNTWSGGRGLFSLNAGSGANRMDLRLSGHSFVSVGSSGGSALFTTGFTQDALNVYCFRYSRTLGAISLLKKGGTIVTATGLTLPTVTLLQLGGLDNNAAANLHGHLPYLAYYPRYVSDSEFIALSNL